VNHSLVLLILLYLIHATENLNYELVCLVGGFCVPRSCMEWFCLNELVIAWLCYMLPKF
jgi:hypothetical protein